MGVFSDLKGRHAVPGTLQTGSLRLTWVRRRGRLPLALGIILLLLVYAYLRHESRWRHLDVPRPAEDWTPRGENASFWKNVPVHYPPASIRPLPTGPPVRFPRVQATKFPVEMQPEARARRQERQEAVKLLFAKHWRAYRKRTWDTGEPALGPGVLGYEWNGWAPTLLAALDTLWLMGMEAEFDEAVAAVETIDFTFINSVAEFTRLYGKAQVSIGYTTTRHLGGLLSAYDLSGDARLLRKAVELGEMLYKAFDTPSRFPIMWWYPYPAARGERQVELRSEAIGDLGSLTLEFTRLSMLTGDARWFDAMQRVMDVLAAQQDSGRVPGLWPAYGRLDKMVFDDGSYYPVPTMAAALAKTVALVGGRLPAYRAMYETGMDAAARSSLFAPMTPTNEDILIARGQIPRRFEAALRRFGPGMVVDTSSCSLGGSLALGGRLFSRERDQNAAKRLVDGCMWVCKAWGHGSIPFKSSMVPCPTTNRCPWSEETWKEAVVREARADLSLGDFHEAAPDAIIDAERLPKGFTPPTRGRYALGPEAIESVFVLYRITGRPELLESAWDMFTAITRTWGALNNTSLEPDSTRRTPQAADLLAPSWMGATLKYFYLIFGDPALASLDDFVFNAEAHLLRRLVR